MLFRYQRQNIRVLASFILYVIVYSVGS